MGAAHGEIGGQLQEEAPDGGIQLVVNLLRLHAALHRLGRRVEQGRLILDEYVVYILQLLQPSLS